MALILIGNLWRSLRGELREEAVPPDVEYRVSHEQKTQGRAK
jgi:hypothetical protein